MGLRRSHGLRRWAAILGDPKGKASLGGGDRFHVLCRRRYADATKQRLRSTLDGAARFARWAEGPIDKYGLSYFIVSKVSNVSTLAAGAAAAAHGLDVASLLSTLGLSGELQGDSGLLACTVAVNVGFTPLHFLGAVRSWGAARGRLQVGSGPIAGERVARNSAANSVVSVVLQLCLNLAKTRPSTWVAS